MTMLEKSPRPKSAMRQADPKQLYSLAEFEVILHKPGNANRLLELIHGEIVEKMPTQQHGLIALNIGSALTGYAREYKNGRPGVEVRHQATGDDRNSRLPDVSFTRADVPIVEQGSVENMPDLAIEIKSPSDTIKEMRETAAYYLANGSRLVWLVYPDYRIVEVYRPDADVEILDEEQTLSGHDVLPDFELAVADVFADPFSA